MKKLFFLSFICLLQYAASGQQSLFNEGWKFYKGDIPGAEKTPADTGSWRPVRLPHDWSIEGPFSEQWASATGYLPGGIGWYKKTFTAPAAWRSKKVFIYFDGVYKNSTVWLNGHLLGNRPNGWIPFEYELTRYLNTAGPNTLAVKVDHTGFADARWYTGSGIYRNVYLKVAEPVHIATWGVRFSTPVVSQKEARANTGVIIINQSGKDGAVTVISVLKDAKGAIVARSSTRVNAKAGDSTAAKLSFAISQPQLWSVDRPALYSLTVSLQANGRPTDTWTEPVGIRKIRIDADSGFFLNDRNLKLKGVCLHDDAGALGVAVPEAVWRRRLQTLKEGGCNSIRMSHNPHADYFYRLCDELGFLVLDEAFDEWEFGKNKWIQGWNAGKPGKDGYHEYFKEWAHKDLRDMVLRNYNHPSIIAWSIGNEIDYPNDPYTSEVLSQGNNPQIYGRGYSPGNPPVSRLGDLSKELVQVVKQYDTTRPVTAALAGVVMSNTTSYPENLDWVGYNYQEYRYADDHKQYPGRIIYGSENGMQLKAWDAVDSNLFISAQYLWTGIDYLGEAGKWPQRSNGAGLLDLAGFPKPEYYFRQSLWSSKPMIYIGTSPIPREEDRGIWSQKRAEARWNYRQGDKLRVNCFTNCTEAELFLNGQSLGKKALSSFPARVIYWDVDYAAGDLKVIGYNKGRALTNYTLQTAGPAYAIKVVAEGDTVGKTGLTGLAISIVDKGGNRVPNADNEVSLSIDGAAVLLGIESGDSRSHEDYKAAHRKAYNGRLKAYLQLTNKTKATIMTLRSPGLQEAKIKL
jgi:beta-galactosidase